MPILILSPDPDFQMLIEFLLRFHGIEATAAPFERAFHEGLLATPPAVLIADLADEEALDDLAKVVARRRAGCSLIVLSKPGRVMEAARRLLPSAAAFLPVPLRPAQLVSCIKGLSPDQAVQGFAFARWSGTCAAPNASD